MRAKSPGSLETRPPVHMAWKRPPELALTSMIYIPKNAMLDALISRSHPVSFRPTSRRQTRPPYVVAHRMCQRREPSHFSALWASLLHLDSRRALDALALVLGRLSRRIIHLPTGFQGGRNPGGNFIWLPLRRPARSIRL